NPPAYHVYSAALLSMLEEVAPDLVGPSARKVIEEQGQYLRALVAPDGDVALAGRSQLQSWTLAAVAVVAASRMTGPEAPEWRELGNRSLARLSGREYRDRTGVFAITPSARGQTLSGIDSYAFPVTYNGLSLMFLEQAARGWRDSVQSADGVAADADGFWADLEGSRLIAARAGTVWWQWLAAPGSSDVRDGSGLVQVKVGGSEGWRDLLEARPLGTSAGEAGPTLIRGRKSLPFRATSVRADGDALVLNGSWTSAGSTPVAGSIRVAADTDRGSIVLRWTARAGVVFSGCVPLSAGVARANVLRSGRTTVSVGAGVRFSAGRSAPSASSARTKMHCWRGPTPASGVNTLTIGGG
ncbi:MAG: hypothetical protein WCO96_04595, partial [Actinomycetes bacterium]